MLVYSRLCFHTKYQLSPFLIFGINTSSLITEVNIDQTKWRCRFIAHNFFVFLTKKTGKTATESNYDVLFTKSNAFRKSFHRSYFHFAIVFVIYASVHIRRACEIIPAHTYLIYQQWKLCKTHLINHCRSKSHWNIRKIHGSTNFNTSVW